MAKQLLYSLTIRGIDSGDTSTDLEKLIATESDGASLNFVEKRRFDIATGVGPVDIYPADQVGNDLEVILFFQYDASEPLATQKMTVTSDTFAEEAGLFFAAMCDASLTITSGATLTTTVNAFYYVRA